MFKKIFFLLLLATIGISCSNNDDSNNNSSTGTTISLKLNGVNQTATITSAQLIKSQGSDEKLLQIIAENTDYSFQLNFFGSYSANNTLPLGNYIFDEESPEGYFYVSYKSNGNTFGMHLPQSGNLTISSMNESSLTVSGTFNQVLTGGGEVGGQTLPETLTVTDGTFSNIVYTVINL